MAPFRMLDQLHPSTEQFISPTGLRVRQDLYDEDYSGEDYEQMLSMYEGTMSQIVEGEIVKSKVLRVTDNAVILDVGFKSEGSVPLDEFKDPNRPRRATRSRSSWSTWRTRRARSSSPRRRPTSCGSGKRSAWPTRATSRSKAPWSRRSRVAWW